MTVRMLLYRAGFWRFMAWFFGTVSRSLEALHDRIHDERVVAWRCEMCEDRWQETWE